MKRIVPLLALVLVGCGFASGEFDVSLERYEYSTEDTIIAHIDASSIPGEYFVTLYGPDGFIESNASNRDYTEVHIQASSIYNGDGEYSIIIENYDIVDIETFYLYDVLVSEDAIDEPEIGGFQRMLGAILGLILEGWAVITFIVLLFLMYLLLRYSKKHHGPGKSKKFGKNRGTGGIQTGDVRASTGGKRGYGRGKKKSTKFGIGLPERKQVNIKTTFGAKGEEIPKTGPIIVDTSVLVKMLDRKIDTSRMVMTETVKREFDNFLKREGKSVPSWLRDIPVKRVKGTRKYIEKLEEKYDMAKRDKEFGREWCKAKATILLNDHGMHHSLYLEDGDQLERAVGYLYNDSKNDRKIVAEAACISDKEAGCIVSTDEDILLFYQYIKYMTGERLKVVRAETLFP